ncbi:MAG: transposase family protein, partial [Ruminococcaceae bacterium]|nr:transposase family protein [Oscillospiraceae bacterium]
MKIEELKGRSSSLYDPRLTNRGNYRHKLKDIIIIGLCSVICGGEDFVDMEDFGKERE